MTFNLKQLEIMNTSTKETMNILDKKVQVGLDLFTIKELMYCSDIKHNTRFIEDLNKTLKTYDSNSNISNKFSCGMGTYNLMIHKRDIGLFCIGMKPHKNWRLKDLKEYFGLKGKKEKCKEQIEFLADLFLIPKLNK